MISLHLTFLRMTSSSSHFPIISVWCSFGHTGGGVSMSTSPHSFLWAISANYHSNPLMALQTFSLSLPHLKRISYLLKNLWQLLVEDHIESAWFEKSESEVAQLCPTLCDPVDCSPPCASVQGIFQARVLEWVAMSFSRGSSRPRDRTQVSRIVSKVLYHLSHQGSPWFEKKYI